MPSTNDTAHNATTNTQKNQKKSKTPKETQKQTQTKTTQNSQNTQNKVSDTKLDSKQSPKENTESTQKSSPIDAPILSQGMQITQDILEDSLHIPENINLQETKELIPTIEHQNNHAPKAKSQELSQKSNTQPHAKTTQTNTESTQNGDSKQQSQNSHTPQDSQKSSINQNAQIANEEFVQDLEQSARHIEHIHTQTSKETPTSKQTQTSKEATQSQTTNATPTMQTIKPDIFYKSVMARQSVYNFASQLTQEMLNYKPPITKLSLELNPQNLGTLELTISKNGKDLQVQVISNPTAINLFVNNQMELRNNLAQMGFNNVDLSFSQNNANSGQRRQQGRRDQAQTYNTNQGNENSLESHTMFITIPQYA